jgi:MFS transporter, ACS family, hexuronate transporter
MPDGYPQEPPYRWYILTLAALTHTLACAMPVMCMPVLFKEIAADLHLNLVQIGSIWGLMAFPAVFTSLAGGVMSDKIGTRRTLIIFCLLVGLTGAARGWAHNLLTLAASGFLFGMMRSVLPMTVHKTCGLWFSKRQLGLANGVVSMGMALGFMAGSMLSATLLSPWLGGWRNVLVFYGVLSGCFSLLWYFARPHSADLQGSAVSARSRNIFQAVRHISQNRNIWLLGSTLLLVSGCVQGVLGYLPLYLRKIGWPEANADAALATFHGMSMLCTIPLAFWSDRLGSRKRVLLAATYLTIGGVSLLAVTDGIGLWFAVILTGLVRDGFMAVLMTLIIEMKGVGAAYAGTALGFVMSFSGLGSLLAPPLGNSLAMIAPSLPFACWALLAVVAAACLYCVKET